MPARETGTTSESTGGVRARQRRLARIRRLAHLLDARFAIPGTGWCFGLDGLVGLVPGVGDTITAAFSVYIILEAMKLGAPKGVIGRMIGNIAIDYVVGSIPLAGDLFDFAWKANIRNVALLDEHLSAAQSAPSPGAQAS